MMEEVRRTGTKSCRPFGPRCLIGDGYPDLTPGLPVWGPGPGYFMTAPSGLQPIVTFRGFADNIIPTFWAKTNLRCYYCSVVTFWRGLHLLSSG